MFYLLSYSIEHGFKFIPDNITLKASLHGVVSGLLSPARGGNFKSGYMSAFFSKLAGGIKVGEDWVQGAFQTLVGGTASEIGGGKFANGAVSAAVVYLFNDSAGTYPSEDEMIDVPDYISRNREVLLVNAQDGYLTLDEVTAWYRYANGAPLEVNGDDLWVLQVNIGGKRDIIFGGDYFIHGQVWIGNDGKINSQKYHFNMHNGNSIITKLRNWATRIGKMTVAGEGTAFLIKYKYKSHIIDLRSGI
jgi:hypothetical protein